jgi:hypothetical protein
MLAPETPQSGRALPVNVAAHEPDQGKRKGNIMTQSLMDEDSLKRILLGAVIGGAVTIFAGFQGLGWTLDGTAKDLAKKSASAAVIEALAPICVDKFQHAADADKNKVELQKASSSDQIVFIEKGGWAAMPGNSSSNNAAVAQACAKMLGTLK